MTNIIHGLSNEEYRGKHGHSASFLKACLKSVKHALTPRKKTKAMETGLRVHEFILERDVFERTYAQGLNPEDYPDAIFTAEDLKTVAKKLNESRKPKLKTTGSKDALLAELGKDDPDHLSGVDVSALSATDIKNQIKHINEQPNRGVIALSGSSMELYERMRAVGWDGEYFPALERAHAESVGSGFKVLSYEEYKKYDDMYKSLIEFLKTCAEYEEANDNGTIMQWLYYAFTTPDVLETEVSVFTENDKCRFDARFKSIDKYIGLDLKSTNDASEEGFIKQASRLHYDLQAAHYEQVANDAGDEIISFPFIAIETDPPYAVNVFIPDDDFMEMGRKKRAYAKQKIAEYESSECNTAYEPCAKELSIPAWANYGPWVE